MSDWRLRANCRDLDPNLFMPTETGFHEHLDLISRCCADCPVRDDFCLPEVRHFHTDAFAGGLTAIQRRDLLEVRPRQQVEIEHGTNGGYQLHVRREGTPVKCVSCKKAHALAASGVKVS